MIGTWPFAVAGLLVVWLLFRRFPGKLEESDEGWPTSDTLESSGESFKWPSLGEFRFEVVGESHYQATLRQNAGNHGNENASTECIAQLIPDDGNSYDDKAVEVCVRGMTVGHLSRDDARGFRRRLRANKLAGQTTFCDAQIVGGGTDSSGQIYSYGIRLDIKPFDQV